MKKLSTLLSKKSFFVALVVDVLGILLSFLVNASLTNIMLARVGLFFYKLAPKKLAMKLISKFQRNKMKK